MATYAIGDIHGCYRSLRALLEKINYRPQTDILWFTGDLVGKGPEPLRVLRQIKSMHEENPRLQIVLGNHDLHLIATALAVFEPAAEAKQDPTLAETLAADAKDPTLLDWLRCQPLLCHSREHHTVLTHAGIPHIWTLNTAKQQARTIEKLLRLPRPELKKALPLLYGNRPNGWSQCADFWDRARLSVNYLTRMRFCDNRGSLDLEQTGKTHPNSDYAPWFSYEPLVTQRQVFGHWAALRGKTGKPGIWGMDYGCVWGDTLAARSPEDGRCYFAPYAEKISSEKTSPKKMPPDKVTPQ